jgi:hypothetical protein
LYVWQKRAKYIEGVFRHKGMAFVKNDENE